MALALLLAAAALPGVLAAQDRVDRCAGGDAAARAACYEAILGLEGARSLVGLSLSGGAGLPGSSSTLGKRIGSTPRLALALRGGLTRGHLPGSADGAAPRDDETAWLPSLRAGAALGLFDGFSLAPTVGGILSVDLLGDLGVSFAGEEDGFDGAVTAPGVGLRIGVFRESFTLPGVTVTATRRWGGDATFTGAGAAQGAPGNQGDQGEGADFSTTVTSVRATAGKEFFALGVLGGVGWDRYEGDGTVRIGPTPSSPLRSVEVDDLRSERFLVFGGGSYNLLILQISGELGWAGGLDGPPERTAGGGAAGSYDPGSSALFGGLAFRLTF